MGCFGGCFMGLRKSCSEFRARLRNSFIRRKIVPQGTSNVAASENSSIPIPEEATDRDRDSRTPEALNQVVDEFVAYEIKKIKALGQIESNVIAEELMARGATYDEINEAVLKERKDGMVAVDI